jgi:hypothetical protein
MTTTQEELQEVMNQNDILNNKLWDAHSELRSMRIEESEMLTSDNRNISVTTLETDSSRIRQTIWYVILALTLFLFSKFLFQSGKYATSVSSSIALTIIVILFITVTASKAKVVYSTTSMWLPLIISLIVILYSIRYIISR